MITFTSFFASDNPEKVAEYSAYMRLGIEALKRTNPEARYVILTDSVTAPHLEDIAEVAVKAPPDIPLMLKFMVAQMNWEQVCTDALSILAEPDCLVNRSLVDAIPQECGLAITYRKHIFPINNVAYVRDHDLARWFLERAVNILWDRQNEEVLGHRLGDWYGDQVAWDAALQPWEINPSRLGNVQLAIPSCRMIRLYPCETHNHILRHSGQPREATKQAYIVNFKGDRKRHMKSYLTDHVR